MMETAINKFQREIILALALILIGAGYTASYEAPYNKYELRVNEIDAVMQGVLQNPSIEAYESAQYELSIQGDWANRQTDEKKGDFEAYLESCNDVIISLYHGEQPDTSKMNSLKNKLI